MTPDSTPPSPVTGTDIRRGLAAVGLRAGDVVLVHSSLKAFGRVDGGADTVIDALLAGIAPGGTLVMPTFTWNGFHAQQRATFDVLRTPSETGLITEVFRRRPGVLRSSHLCHSVAAQGPHAQEALGDGISGVGRGSPFTRLMELDAWVLLLGVGFSSCTALHTAEELAGVPYRQYRDYAECTIIMPDGTPQPSRAREFLRVGEVANDLGKMGTVFARHGVLHTAKVGNADLTAVRIRDIVGITLDYLKEDVRFLTAG